MNPQDVRATKRSSFCAIHASADSIIGRLSLILADIIVIVVTWRKTFGVSRDNFRFGFNFTVGTVLLRDGTSDEYTLRTMNDFADRLFGRRQCVFRVRALETLRQAEGLGY